MINFTTDELKELDRALDLYKNYYDHQVVKHSKVEIDAKLSTIKDISKRINFELYNRVIHHIDD